jgi:hypothetical protein
MILNDDFCKVALLNLEVNCTIRRISQTDNRNIRSRYLYVLCHKLNTFLYLV